MSKMDKAIIQVIDPSTGNSINQVGLKIDDTNVILSNGITLKNFIDNIETVVEGTQTGLAKKIKDSNNKNKTAIDEMNAYIKKLEFNNPSSNEASIVLWAPNKEYKMNDVVLRNYNIYVCKEDHMSTIEFDESKWKPASNTSNMTPVGMIMAYAGDGVPSGWLLCDGSAVSITTYTNLYNVIGNKYGVGADNTFVLPDIADITQPNSSTIHYMIKY